MVGAVRTFLFQGNSIVCNQFAVNWKICESYWLPTTKTDSLILKLEINIMFYFNKHKIAFLFVDLITLKPNLRLFHFTIGWNSTNITWKKNSELSGSKTVHLTSSHGNILPFPEWIQHTFHLIITSFWRKLQFFLYLFFFKYWLQSNCFIYNLNSVPRSHVSASNSLRNIQIRKRAFSSLKH